MSNEEMFVILNNIMGEFERYEKAKVLDGKYRIAIEQIIENYKLLEKENEELSKLLEEKTMRIGFENCIPKSKVKEKLNQIHEEYNTILANEKRSLQDKNICDSQHRAMRTVLEELLEEGEKYEY